MAALGGSLFALGIACSGQAATFQQLLFFYGFVSCEYTLPFPRTLALVGPPLPCPFPALPCPSLPCLDLISTSAGSTSLEGAFRTPDRWRTNRLRHGRSAAPSKSAFVNIMYSSTMRSINIFMGTKYLGRQRVHSGASVGKLSFGSRYCRDALWDMCPPTKLRASCCGLSLTRARPLPAHRCCSFGGICWLLAVVWVTRQAGGEWRTVLCCDILLASCSILQVFATVLRSISDCFTSILNPFSPRCSTLLTGYEKHARHMYSLHQENVMIATPEIGYEPFEEYKRVYSGLRLNGLSIVCLCVLDSTQEERVCYSDGGGALAVLDGGGGERGVQRRRKEQGAGGGGRGGGDGPSSGTAAAVGAAAALRPAGGGVALRRRLPPLPGGGGSAETGFPAAPSRHALDDSEPIADLQVAIAILQATPFLTELFLIGTHNREVLTYWLRFTQGVSNIVRSNGKPIGKVPTYSFLKAVHDKESTFEINLRKMSLFLHAYILTGALSDMRPVKLVTVDGKLDSTALYALEELSFAYWLLRSSEGFVHNTYYYRLTAERGKLYSERSGLCRCVVKVIICRKSAVSGFRKCPYYCRKLSSKEDGTKRNTEPTIRRGTIVPVMKIDAPEEEKDFSGSQLTTCCVLDETGDDHSCQRGVKDSTNQISHKEDWLLMPLLFRLRQHYNCNGDGWRSVGTREGGSGIVRGRLSVSGGSSRRSSAMSSGPQRRGTPGWWARQSVGSIYTGSSSRIYDTRSFQMSGDDLSRGSSRSSLLPPAAIRATEVSMEYHRNEGAGKTEDPREKPADQRHQVQNASGESGESITAARRGRVVHFSSDRGRVRLSESCSASAYSITCSKKVKSRRRYLTARCRRAMFGVCSASSVMRLPSLQLVFIEWCGHQGASLYRREEWNPPSARSHYCNPGHFVNSFGKKLNPTILCVRGSQLVVHCLIPHFFSRKGSPGFNDSFRSGQARLQIHTAYLLCLRLDHSLSDTGRLDFTVLYILEPASFLHWLQPRGEVTAFLTRLHVIGAHNCEVFIYWHRVTWRVSKYGPVTNVLQRKDGRSYELTYMYLRCSEMPVSVFRLARSRRGMASPSLLCRVLARKDIHGDSSPFLLQPFHELSNGFWPRLTSPHPGFQFIPKMLNRVEVGALGGPVQSANIVVGVPLPLIHGTWHCHPGSNTGPFRKNATMLGAFAGVIGKDTISSTSRQQCCCPNQILHHQPPFLVDPRLDGHYRSTPFSLTLGAAMAERLTCSPPTKANWDHSSARSLPDFRKWKSYWTMPLVGGFSLGSPIFTSPFISVLLQTYLNNPHRLSRPRSFNFNKEFSYLTGPLRIRQHRHGSYVIRVQTVNTFQKVIQTTKTGERRGSTLSASSLRWAQRLSVGSVHSTASILAVVVDEDEEEGRPHNKASTHMPANWLDYSPPYWFRFPERSPPDSRTWESCRDDAAGRRVFSGISRFPRPFHSGAAPYSPRVTLIISQDLDFKSSPNFFTHSPISSLKFPGPEAEKTYGDVCCIQQSGSSCRTGTRAVVPKLQGVPVCVQKLQGVPVCVQKLHGVPMCVQSCKVCSCVSKVARCARVCPKLQGVPMCVRSCKVCPCVSEVARCARVCPKLQGVPVCVRNCKVCPCVSEVARCARVCPKLQGVPVCVRSCKVCPCVSEVARCARVCPKLQGVPVCVRSCKVCPCVSEVARCVRVCPKLQGVPVCVRSCKVCLCVFEVARCDRINFTTPSHAVWRATHGSLLFVSAVPRVRMDPNHVKYMLDGVHIGQMMWPQQPLKLSGMSLEAILDNSGRRHCAAKDYVKCGQGFAAPGAARLFTWELGKRARVLARAALEVEPTCFLRTPAITSLTRVGCAGSRRSSTTSTRSGRGRHGGWWDRLSVGSVYSTGGSRLYGSRAFTQIFGEEDRTASAASSQDNCRPAEDVDHFGGQRLAGAGGRSSRRLEPSDLVFFINSFQVVATRSALRSETAMRLQHQAKNAMAGAVRADLTAAMADLAQAFTKSGIV
ncbi:hypothetical protein PR048_027360 [Dryococelus australis]|uniref:Uncharacterized protein n=1 Tax=Dryococelus australis TaxID=614101 RepID=A0ABQ9GF84_9NEOP|nr:hypothetical protein PR048_027360 [Dryococelus australis]